MSLSAAADTERRPVARGSTFFCGAEVAKLRAAGPRSLSDRSAPSSQMAS